MKDVSDSKNREYKMPTPLRSFLDELNGFYRTWIELDMKLDKHKKKRCDKSLISHISEVIVSSSCLSALLRTTYRYFPSL